jgi:hypothetical protein
MVEPASSYAAVSIALHFKQGMQSLRHEKAVSQGETNMRSLHLFPLSFDINVHAVPTRFQMEMTDLQYDTDLTF